MQVPHNESSKYIEEITSVAKGRSVSKPNNFSTSTEYVGKKEDDNWWSKIDNLDNNQIYEHLVSNMGIFRWQSVHGFRAGPNRNSSNLLSKWKNIKEEALNNRYQPISSEYGGSSLFDFVVKAHKYIAMGNITISDWHKCVKIIFNQIIECVEYMHSKNVCHFDISLENILINDIDVHCYKDINGIQRIKFVEDDIQIKLCDFGLAEIFDPKKNSKFLCNKYVGKPNYQSPEIVSKQKLFSAKKNDIWCMGICLFMLIIARAHFGESLK